MYPNIVDEQMICEATAPRRTNEDENLLNNCAVLGPRAQVMWEYFRATVWSLIQTIFSEGLLTRRKINADEKLCGAASPNRYKRHSCAVLQTYTTRK